MNTNITPHLGSVSNGNPDQAIVNTVSVPCLNFGLAMYLVPRRPRRAPCRCPLIRLLRRISEADVASSWALLHHGRGTTTSGGCVAFPKAT